MTNPPPAGPPLIVPPGPFARGILMLLGVVGGTAFAMLVGHRYFGPGAVGIARGLLLACALVLAALPGAIARIRRHRHRVAISVAGMLLPAAAFMLLPHDTDATAIQQAMLVSLCVFVAGLSNPHRPAPLGAGAKWQVAALSALATLAFVLALLTANLLSRPASLY